MRTLPARHRTVGRLLIAVVVTVALLAACRDDDAPVTTDDTGGDTTSPSERPADRTEYRSVEITEDGRPRALVPGTTISLHVGDDGSIGASLGCNSMGGRFGLDGEVLVLHDGLSMTEMGCDPELHAQDEWFADLLGAQPRFVIEGDTLTIATDSTTVVLRERSVVDPDRSLVDTIWEVTGFVDGEVAMSIGAELPARVVFETESSTVHLDDGCGRTERAFEVDGDRVRLGSGGDIEDEGCNDPEYQRRVRAIVLDHDALDWEVAADRLTLRAPDGTGVTLRAVE